MKVALFAPYLTPDQGGVWNFYQWVASHPGIDTDLLHIGRAQLLNEISHIADSRNDRIVMETIFESAQTSGLNRILKVVPSGKFSGVNLPLYNGIMNRLRRFCLRRSVEHEVARIIKSKDIDLIHIPVQRVAMPKLIKQYPYVINPHDYQHEHFPEFFTKDEINRRRQVWYKDQRDANAVVVHSRQTRSDAIRFLGIPEERIFYAPYGALDNFPIPDDEALYRTSERFNLPERFIFYPAKAWPHKNHLILLDAIQQLKKRDVLVNVVFTSIEDEHGEVIKQKVDEAGLKEQVIITGRISQVQMAALYSLCTMVVVTSLFEQNSGPVLEAIYFGKAVAVSRIEEVVTTLDGCGLLFNPNSASEIAGAIDSLWSSTGTLEKVEAEIRRRRENMTWDSFRKAYRQAYEYALDQGPCNKRKF